MYRGIRGSGVDKNNNLAEIFFIFKKNQFCVGKFKPLDFPGKGKKQMLEVRGRPRGRGGAPAKIRIYTEYRKYTRYSQSLFYFWNFPDIWCSKYWCFKFCIHVSSISLQTFFMKSTKLFRRRWSIYHFGEHTNKMKWITFSRVQSKVCYNKSKQVIWN